MPVEAELRRRRASDQVLIPWNLNDDGTDPVADSVVRSTLAAILTELGQKLESGGTVALDTATLTALENVTVTVANPTTNPETGLAKEVTLTSILTELGQKYEGGPIALDAASLAALETVQVGNFPATQAITAASLPLPAGAAAEATLANLLSQFRDRYDAVLTAAVTANVVGPTTVIDAGAGQELRVVWLNVQADADITGSVEVTLKLGSRTLYRFDLIGSQPFAHSAVHEGGAGDDLIIELDQSVPVYVNVDYRVAA